MDTLQNLHSLCTLGARLPTHLPSPPRASRESVERAVERAIAEAVADASGPVAIALSGGVDSTVVAAGLCRAGLRPRAYALDTGRAAREARDTAAALNLPLELLPLPPGGIRGTPPADVAEALGQPTHSGAPFGFLPLYRALAERGGGTVFTGDGADEAFGGHAYHRAPPATWDPAIWPTWRAIRSLGIAAERLLPPDRRPWIESPAAVRVAGEVRRLPVRGAGSAARLRWLDLRLRQGPQCVDLQRALATHCGLGYRAPLAHPAVTAAALACPIVPDRPKRPLVELAEAWLGRPWRRRKQPMHTPTGGQPLDDDWLRWLTPKMVARHAIFAQDEVRRLVASVDVDQPWLPRALVVVATTHAGVQRGAFDRASLSTCASAGAQLRGASSSK